MENKKEFTEEEMELLKVEQKEYVRNSLIGNSCFFQKQSVDVDEIITKTMVEVTPYGYNKNELDRKINKCNETIFEYAVSNDLLDDLNKSNIEITNDAVVSLSEKISHMGWDKNLVQANEEIQPQTTDEKILKKLEDIENQNMTPGQMHAKAKNELEGLFDRFF